MNDQQRIEAIFFDLDGTLLPMDQSYFIKKYFQGLAAFGAGLGIDPKKLVEGTLAGTEVMINNDGTRTNKEAFWDTYFSYVGEKDEQLPSKIDGFYIDGFKALKEHTSSNPLAATMVSLAHMNDRKVVLATNPVFPMAAQLERISWLGLSALDFDYITSYDNSTFCKPNPQYYLEICEKIGVRPENCIMLGNDESDDMKGASQAGMRCFLITDHRIMSNNFVWTGERGTFKQALNLIERL